MASQSAGDPGTALAPLNVLVMNAGSSSQKCCLYRIEKPTALPDDPPDPLWQGKIEWGAPGADGAAMTVQTSTVPKNAASKVQDRLPIRTARPEGVFRLLKTMWQGECAVIGGPEEITVVGHRVVHGGRDFHEPTRISTAIKEAIEQLAPLAPQHNPAALEGIRIIEERLGPHVPQIAVFDTAFHRTIPDATAIYPGPHAWAAQGIRRYGFHGINHAWCAARAARMLPEHDTTTLRLICCHLGNGASLAAVRGGQCVDTTMGFTPLEGLMMGSRSGSVDPGIILHLLAQPGAPSVAELGRILNEESGLKGLSGVSEDMRAVVTAIETGNARARLALDVYTHRLRGQIGAMTASLGGLDALVFTAGVGENSATVRAAACGPFAFLGLLVDEAKNRDAPSDNVERDISRADSRVRVLVIPAREDWAVARECGQWAVAANVVE